MTAVYALLDPVGRVRYVGRSVDPSQRLRSHLADGGGSPKARWLRELAARGERPTLRVLERCEPVEAARRELRWIRRLDSRGVALTNVRGLRARPFTPAPRERRSPAELLELWRAERAALGPYGRYGRPIRLIFNHDKEVA